MQALNLGINIEAFDKKKVSLSFLMNKTSIEIFLDSINLYPTKNLDEILSYFDNYNNVDLMNGPFPSERELFKNTNIPYDTSPKSNMFRCLAIMSYKLQFKSINAEIGNPLLVEYVTFIENNIFDKSDIEKLGNLGPQPTIYFIKKDYLKANKKEIDFLFNLGLLHKVTLNFINEIESYYIPFDLPSIRRNQLENYYPFWLKLLKDREDKSK